jgi:DNA recombination protein RmuC
MTEILEYALAGGALLCCLGLSISGYFVFRYRSRLYQQSMSLDTLRETNVRLQAELMFEKQRSLDQVALLEQARKTLSDSFQALSAQALQMNNQMFLDLAQSTLAKFHSSAQTDLVTRQKAIDEMLTPLKTSLITVDQKIQALESARVGAYEALKQHLSDLVITNKELKKEASHLAHALKAPNVRGFWGEIQLRRVVEIAGMIDHCDFSEQIHVKTATGSQRPDMIIHLPGNKKIVIDAKVPLTAYLEGLELSDHSQALSKMSDHARHLRSHMMALSNKGYWENIDPSPEFVVLFLPSETIFSAALEHDPALIEFGIKNQVILATPTTLIALLKAVAYGWQQASLAENAKEIAKLGQQLYKRLSDMAEHVQKLGRHIGQVVEAYNSMAGNLERRVFVGARRFKDLGVTGDKLPETLYIDKSLRSLATDTEADMEMISFEDDQKAIG